MKEEDWEFVSDDERGMRLKDELNEAKGYVCFVLNKNGVGTVFVNMGKCNPMEIWSLFAFARFQSDYELKSRVYKTQED